MMNGNLDPKTFAASMNQVGADSTPAPAQEPQPADPSTQPPEPTTTQQANPYAQQENNAAKEELRRAQQLKVLEERLRAQSLLLSLLLGVKTNFEDFLKDGFFKTTRNDEEKTPLEQIRESIGETPKLKELTDETLITAFRELIEQAKAVKGKLTADALNTYCKAQQISPSTLFSPYENKKLLDDTIQATRANLNISLPTEVVTFCHESGVDLDNKLKSEIEEFKTYISNLKQTELLKFYTEKTDLAFLPEAFAELKDMIKTTSSPIAILKFCEKHHVPFFDKEVTRLRSMEPDALVALANTAMTTRLMPLCIKLSGNKDISPKVALTMSSLITQQIELFSNHDRTKTLHEKVQQMSPVHLFEHFGFEFLTSDRLDNFNAVINNADSVLALINALYGDQYDNLTKTKLFGEEITQLQTELSEKDLLPLVELFGDFSVSEKEEKEKEKEKEDDDDNDIMEEDALQDDDEKIMEENIPQGIITTFKKSLDDMDDRTFVTTFFGEIWNAISTTFDEKLLPLAIKFNEQQKALSNLFDKVSTAHDKVAQQEKDADQKGILIPSVNSATEGLATLTALIYALPETLIYKERLQKIIANVYSMICENHAQEILNMLLEQAGSVLTFTVNTATKPFTLPDGFSRDAFETISGISNLSVEYLAPTNIKAIINDPKYSHYFYQLLLQELVANPIAEGSRLRRQHIAIKLNAIFKVLFDRLAAEQPVKAMKQLNQFSATTMTFHPIKPEKKSAMPNTAHLIDVLNQRLTHILLSNESNMEAYNDFQKTIKITGLSEAAEIVSELNEEPPKKPMTATEAFDFIASTFDNLPEDQKAAATQTLEDAFDLERFDQEGPEEDLEENKISDYESENEQKPKGPIHPVINPIDLTGKENKVVYLPNDPTPYLYSGQGQFVTLSKAVHLEEPMMLAMKNGDREAVSDIVYFQGDSMPYALLKGGQYSIPSYKLGQEKGIVNPADVPSTMFGQSGSSPQEKEERDEIIMDEHSTISPSPQGNGRGNNG